MEEVAMGFINVANEAMCRPIRYVTYPTLTSINTMIYAQLNKL
jgi:N-methylhydantoinase A/oxoprolinase/acetone carboxylase beta subunit